MVGCKPFALRIKTSRGLVCDNYSNNLDISKLNLDAGEIAELAWRRQWRLTPLYDQCIFIVDTEYETMKARIQKWGNSLALRIPKALAEEIHVQSGSQVELSLVNGKIVVEPVIHTAWTLEDLLEGVTDENLHLEIETGTSVGKEAW